MGNRTLSTAEKCIFGVIDAMAHGKKPGPSVIENCEVAQQEAKERAKETELEKKAPKEPQKKQARKKLKIRTADYAEKNLISPEKILEYLKQNGESIYFFEKKLLLDKNPKFKITPPKSLLEKLHSLKKYEEVLKFLQSNPNLLRRQEMEIIEELFPERKKRLQSM